MIIPFFIEKTLSLFKKKKKASKQQTSYPRAAYIKSHNGTQWHHTENLDSLRWSQYTSHTKYGTQGGPATFHSSYSHQAFCAKTYDVETVDGSKYYLCQHGVHIK